MQIKSVRLECAVEARKLCDQLRRTDPKRYDGPSTLQAMNEAVTRLKVNHEYRPTDPELRRMILSSMMTLHY